MTKKKTKTTTILGFGLLAVLLLVVGFYSQTFSAIDLQRDTVYIPVFTNTECGVVVPDHEVAYDYADKQDNNGWASFYCSYKDHDVYTNRCVMELEASDGAFLGSYITEIYKCPVGTAWEDRKDDCVDIRVGGSISYDPDQFLLLKAKEGLGFGTVDEGDITITVVSNWYGLKSIDSNNFLSKEYTCDISRLQEAGFTLLKEERDAVAPEGTLAFNGVINYISAQRPSVSKNIIQYEGNIVWTIGNGEVCPVKQDINGIRFVDVSDCSTATEIICNPALPFCSDDGTEVINIDTTGGTAGGKSCSEIYGSFVNTYVPTANDPTVVCQYECADGNLKPDSCKKIPSCSEGTLNDEYVCVTANVPQGDDDSSPLDPTLVFIVLGFIVVVLVMVAVKVKKDGNGKSGF